MFSADDEIKEGKRKEEGEKRRILDTDDRNRVYEELKKHSHPLKLISSILCNISNGQVANASVNVQETCKMGRACSLTSDRHYLVASTPPAKKSQNHGIYQMWCNLLDAL